MTLLIQISDTHFGTERPAVVDALVRMVREQGPTLVVLSGDITQRARRSQFLAARAFVERLGVPITLAIPGNHDIPLFDVMARVFRPYANYRRTFGHELESAFDAETMLVLTVNTTRAWRHTKGAVSSAQVERVARRLELAGDAQLRIVVTHQPVCVTREQDRHNVLVGHAHAVRRWSAAGADLILGGHIHLPFLQPLHECVVDLPRRVWAVQAGTAVSTRVRHDAGNSVNLIRSGGGSASRRCLVERWDYMDTSHCFAPVSVDELSFDGAALQL